MEEENKEERDTSENTQEDLETSQNQDDEKENSETNEDGSKKSDEDLKRQGLARIKKAEQKAKRLEAEKLMLEKEIKENSQQATGETPNQADLAKMVVTLKDHSPDEIDYIFKQAKFMGIDPLEAANHEDTKLFLNAKREQRERSEKIPEPSTKQSSPSKSVKDWTNEDLRKASEAGDFEAIDQFRKYARSQG